MEIYEASVLCGAKKYRKKKELYKEEREWKTEKRKRTRKLKPTLTTAAYYAAYLNLQTNH
jgi:hypothetical protein